MQSQLLIGLVEASTSVTPFGVVLLTAVAIAVAVGRLPLSDLTHSSILVFVSTIFCFRGSGANPYKYLIDGQINISRLYDQSP